MFSSIVSSTGTLSWQSIIICTLGALILGFIIALVYMAQGSYTKSYILSLLILPVLVQTVIMIVNGNLGAGVAVMGAFSLVRFRSVPGSSREISGIFFAMVIGLATGMGYLTYAAIITIIGAVIMLVMAKTSFGDTNISEKELKITIPENIDYTQVFTDLLEEYTKDYSLIRVKTTNLGSMYELSYHIQLKKPELEKEFIDKLRCRNGNLTIICGKPVQTRDEM